MPSGLQMRQRRFNHPKGRIDVSLHRRVEIFARNIENRLACLLPRRIAHQNIQATELVHRISDQLPGRRLALLRGAWDHHRARAHRQRVLLQAALARRLPAAPDHGQTDTAVSPADQRQGRTLHPHTARALGIRHALRDRARPRSSPPTRHRHLQSQPTTPPPRRADTASARQRPIRDKHLDD